MDRFFSSTRVVVLALGLVVVLAGGATAQDPSFNLKWSAPESLVGNAGAVLTYDASGSLTTTGLAEPEPGAQGWSLSVGMTGGKLLSVTIAGTSAAPAATGGFEKTELTTGAGNEGAVSAVVLSFAEALTLPPVGTAEILKATVEVTVPEPVEVQGELSCDSLDSKIAFVDGRTGSGQPVDNKVTWKGNSYLPTKGSATTTVCPKVVKPTNLRVVVTSPPTIGGSPTVGATPYDIDVPVGPATQAVEAGIALASALEGTDGVQGWSASIETGACFNITTATTDGTVAVAARTGGFEKTEVVDPAKNGGRQGAVSAIVLNFTSGLQLAPVSDELVLRLGGSMDASAITGPGVAGPVCEIRVVGIGGSVPLVGSGQPVKTVVTVAGATREPGFLGGDLRLVGETRPPVPLFIRGDANADDKLDIADSIWIINELFKSGAPTVCQDAGDANDDGLLDSSDAVYLINYNFIGGTAPPAPFPACGVDPTEDTLVCDVGSC